MVLSIKCNSCVTRIKSAALGEGVEGQGALAAMTSLSGLYRCRNPSYSQLLLLLSLLLFIAVFMPPSVQLPRC
jgi:hypothetical protein